MAQPPVYNRLVSFTNLESADPSGQPPGASLDGELNLIKQTLDAVLANLALIQSDDGEVANATIGPDQLATSLSVGINTWTVWVTGTGYAVGDTVFHGSGVYRCLIAHTAGTFATDLAALKWVLVLDFSTLVLGAASGIANTPAGNISSTNVQAALNELDGEKAATSHTHPSSAITDSTAAGRAMLSAANVAAQQALLGLGALAFLNSVPITSITAQLALTGTITPAILSSSTNDWTPTGIATAAVIRVSANSTINITGLAAQADGTIIVIHHISGTPITFTANDTASAAANRFLFTRPYVLRTQQSLMLRYDGTTGGWRPAREVTTNPIAAGYKNLKIVNGGTPDSQMTITADALTLEDANGESWRAQSINVTISNLTLNAANGLDVSPLAISTWYSLWVIGNPTTNTFAGLMSASATAPTLPSGYTYKARVGWNRTDATASPNCKFNRIVQYGNKARYTPISGSATVNCPQLASGAQTWPVTTSLVNFVPTATAAAAFIFGAVDGTTGNLYVHPNSSGYTNTVGAAGLTQGPIAHSLGTSGVAISIGAELVLETVNVFIGASGTNTRVFVGGWLDNI